MERSQRINRINALMQRPQGVSMAQLQDELEVSRQTIARDIELMRDQMNAPIIWDRNSGSYRLGQADHYGPSFMLPGVWVSPTQAYAFLTLNNMVEKIAPNLLGPFLDPMRSTIKQMLGEGGFRLYGLDKKIQIDMPAMPSIGDLDFSNLLEGLLEDQVVRVSLKGPNGDQETIQGVPIQLHISPERWLLDLQLISDGVIRQLNLADVIRVAAESEKD